MCLFSWYPHLDWEAGPTVTHSGGEWTVSERAIGLSVISRLPNALSESECGLVPISFTKAMLPFQHLLDGWTPRPRIEYLKRRDIWMQDIVREIHDGGKSWRTRPAKTELDDTKLNEHTTPQKMMWTGLNGYTTQYIKTKGQDGHWRPLPVWSAHWF